MTDLVAIPQFDPKASDGSVVGAPTGPPAIASVADVAVSDVYDTYWRMAFERQLIYYRRLHGLSPPWTVDPIFLRHRFTNAYRAADRVSQYLIRRVIYQGPQSSKEVFFRVLLFKLFNRVSTWELFVDELGPPRYEDWDIRAYDSVLTAAITSGRRIYSAAYIMPPPPGYGNRRKHSNHLALLDEMMSDELPCMLAQASCAEDIFQSLIGYPGVGRFLGYQFTVDLGYSEPFHVSESDFVVAGPGARDGIAKCFTSSGGLTDSELIHLVADCQEAEFSRLGLNFPTLWGRRLQPIDCQNLFCEVSKYSRVAHPNSAGTSGRTRIKQRYRPDNQPLDDPWFPPVWGLNSAIANDPLSSADSLAV